MSKKYGELRETFTQGFSSIRVQPSLGCSGWIEFQEKPRGGSRGAIDTQSFRLLDQEEECLQREATLCPACVSTLSSLDKSRLTRSLEEKLPMKSNTLVRTLALVATLAVSAPLFAKPVTKSLPINHTVKVGKIDVKAGDYRATIDDNHLTLLNGKKVVAESSGRWEARDTKSPYTGIVADSNGRVMELRFEGRSDVFVLSE